MRPLHRIAEMVRLDDDADDFPLWWIVVPVTLLALVLGVDLIVHGWPDGIGVDVSP